MISSMLRRTSSQKSCLKEKELKFSPRIFDRGLFELLDSAFKADKHGTDSSHKIASK